MGKELSPSKKEQVIIKYLVKNFSIEDLQKDLDENSKDDRGRKWGIWFTEGEFPKLEVGPVKLSQNPILCEFTSSNTAYEVYESIHRILNLRTCSYNLTSENIENRKFKSCLEYQIKKCDAPCESLIDKFIYKQICENARLILSFRYEKIEKSLNKLLYTLSNNFEFERANSYHITRYFEEQVIQYVTYSATFYSIPSLLENTLESVKDNFWDLDTDRDTIDWGDIDIVEEDYKKPEVFVIGPMKGGTIN